MNRLISILIFGIQFGITFVLTVCIYMVFALLDYGGGFDSFIGLTLFQPIIAVVISILTILCCLIIGLPIRLISRMKSWWTRHFYVSILLILIGLILLGLSLTPYFIESTTIIKDGFETTEKIPNNGLVITGWFLTAFSTLHMYPPKQLIDKAQTLLTNLKKQNK